MWYLLRHSLLMSAVDDWNMQVTRCSWHYPYLNFFRNTAYAHVAMQVPALYPLEAFPSSGGFSGFQICVSLWRPKQAQDRDIPQRLKQSFGEHLFSDILYTALL